ncbi:MAG: metallophosphoesterase [Bacteroides sp.]|nr:metallophosphoesterase [Bacteroides sp.]
MYISRLDIHFLLKILYWIPTLFLLVGMIYLIHFASEEVARGHSSGWFSIAFLLFVFPKLVFTIFSLIGLLFHYFFKWSTTPFLYVGIALALLNVVGILYGTFIGRNKFVVRQVTYSSSRLPQGFNGYRITLLSDLHVGSWGKNTQPLQQMVNIVNQQESDLIVFTGDLVNHRAIELEYSQSVLSQLHARDGVYSVLGNHDFGPYFPWKGKQDRINNLADLKKREADMGWILLNNAHVTLYNDKDSIALIGVENDGEPPFSQYADLPKALEGTDGLFKILLSHNPTHWRREVLPDSDVDLMLAGHTHALQFQIGRFSFSSRFYKEWGGMYYEGKRGLYVNVGTGHVGIPFRLGAWPEITVIRLVREE